MKKSLVVLAPMAIAVALLSVRGEDQTDRQASVWMKQKLEATKNILGGLTKGDFEAIGKNANSMLAVGYLEKALRADVPGYRTFFGDFEYANKSLVAASKEKNIDKATLAYVQLTVSCVNCHKLIRD